MTLNSGKSVFAFRMPGQKGRNAGKSNSRQALKSEIFPLSGRAVMKAEHICEYVSFRV